MYWSGRSDRVCARARRARGGLYSCAASLQTMRAQASGSLRRCASRAGRQAQWRVARSDVCGGARASEGDHTDGTGDHGAGTALRCLYLRCVCGDVVISLAVDRPREPYNDADVSKHAVYCKIFFPHQCVSNRLRDAVCDEVRRSTKLRSKAWYRRAARGSPDPK